MMASKRRSLSGISRGEVPLISLKLQTDFDYVVDVCLWTICQVHGSIEISVKCN